MSTPKIPILFLLDGSGSMADYGRIQQLNRGVRTLLKGLAEHPKTFTVAAVVFQGNGAYIHFTFTSAEAVQWEEVTPVGTGSISAALGLSRKLLSDLKSDQKPVLFLVSDGLQETEDHEAIKSFVSESPVAECERFALRVVHASDSVLEIFTADTTTHLLGAEDTEDILNFMCT